MARISKGRFIGVWCLLWLTLLIAGCASYEARQVYEQAEQLAAEENFDAAVTKYYEAAELDPSSKNYKLKLLSSRTRAANHHIQQARQLALKGQLNEALDQYRLAREFDPSIEVIRQEEQDLQDLLAARSLAEEGAGFFAQGNLLVAERAIDKALQLDPGNARALAIKDLIKSKRKTVALDGIELDVASHQPITLSFKDAKIKDIFKILSDLSGINFIFDEDIRNESISVLLEKASFAQAMELILQMNGLKKKVLNSKTIIIYPESREKAKQYEDQLIQTFYLSHIDAKKAVNMLRTMLQLRKVYVHEERNALIIRDNPEVIRLAEQILSAADRENSEVIFDLELVAVSSDSGLNLGPQLSTYSVSAGFSNDGTNIVNDALGSTTDGLVQSLSRLETYYTVPSATFDLAKTLSDTEVLASPKIRVRNKEKAKVHIGTREPVITVTQNGDNFSDSVQYVDIGVKLDVEPSIQLNRTVETKLKLEVSQKLDEGTTERGTKFLTISTTNAETVLTLKDGVQTIIGGLFEQQEGSNRRTVPLLGDIPILGALFTNFEDSDTKREILLSITPYIIRQVEIPELDVATIWSGGEDNLKVGPNFGAFAEPLQSEVDVTKPLAAPAVKPAALSLPEPAMDKAAPVPTEPASPPAVPEGSAAPESPSVEPTPDDQTPADLSFDGPREVQQGQAFSMSVNVHDIEGLYSAPLFFSYDPGKLELISINEGDFLRQQGQATVFSSSPNRTTGEVIVGYKQAAGGAGASGSGSLFNLVFKPLTPGEARLAVNRINFRDAAGARLPVSPDTVAITVR
ncbi:MAG: cohesin domain-containing protein [Desulfuromonadales bacterium]